MVGRNYERLDIYEFGKHLLQSQDLDPIYTMLYNSDLEGAQLHRWLIAYWCLYHAGVASYLCEFEGFAFWTELEVAGWNEEASPLGGRWPRGSERRHWRGKQALASTRALSKMYGPCPEDMIAKLVDAAPSYEAVAKQAKKHLGFGDWISFKIADMLDRVLGVHVDFDQAAVFMFKDPAKAAEMFWRDKLGLPDGARSKDRTAMITGVVEHLVNHFKDFNAPPLFDRPIGLQETETILCKFKSHMNGHYPLNNDIDEIREGLEEWREASDVVDNLLNHLPERF